MVYHVIFIPLLNRLVDIDYPYISDYPSYCIVNLGALAQSLSRGADLPTSVTRAQWVYVTEL